MQEKITHKKVGLWIVLIVAASFAVGSCGLLLAVLLQHSAPPSPVGVITPQEAQQLEVERQSVIASLSSPAASSTASSTPSSPEEIAAQMAARMKVLDSLNAK